MSIPKLSADSSLYNSTKIYAGNRNHVSASRTGLVTPQMSWMCTVHALFCLAITEDPPGAYAC
jgi:hypothetical protein